MAMGLLADIVTFTKRFQHKQSMKIRSSIFGIIVFGAVLIALVVWLGKRKSAETSSLAVTPATNAAPRVAAAPSLAVSTPAYTNTPSPQAAMNTATPSTQDKGEQIKEGLAKLNDANIVFYGKVEDQFGSAIANATVNFGVRIYNSSESTVKYGEMKSDENGLFTISGYRGESLGLGVKKTGYVFVSMNGSGIYSAMWPEEKRAHPDKSNPVVIKMWKLQGAESLVSFDRTYKLHYTNTPIYFDLVAGKVVSAGGDLKITVSRPDGIISQQHPQSWSIDFSIIDGGYIESSFKESAVTYAAPESGYQPSGTFGNNNGPNAVDKTFLVPRRF